MNTPRTLLHIAHRPPLLATLAGALVVAFVAGATTAHTLFPPRPADRALTAAAFEGDASSRIDGHAIGRDVYSPRGAPLGRLTALIRGNDRQGAYALIATYDQEATIAGEIAIPVSRLDLQGERLVLSAGSEAPASSEPQRWQM